MTDYAPPQGDAVAFVFKGATYAPPQGDAVAFVFGADDGGADLGLQRLNFTILLTM